MVHCLPCRCRMASVQVVAAAGCPLSKSASRMPVENPLVSSFQASAVHDTRRDLAWAGDDMVIGDNDPHTRRVVGGILPVVVLHIRRIEIAVVGGIVDMSRGPGIGGAGVVDAIAQDRFEGAAVVSVDDMPFSHLIVDHVPGDLFACRERASSDTLRVDSPTVIEHLHMTEDQILRDGIVMREVGLCWLLLLVRPPSPPKGDRCIGGVVDLVMGQGGEGAVADIYPNPSMVFGWQVEDMVVGNGIAQGL